MRLDEYQKLAGRTVKLAGAMDNEDRCTMKPIETIYNGYRFRSRLEARWAVFFDVLGVRYEYELEGFDLGTVGLYLPDFYLPDVGCWVEIKPDEPSDAERAKAYALSVGQGQPVWIISGSPGARKTNMGYLALDYSVEVFGGRHTDTWPVSPFVDWVYKDDTYKDYPLAQWGRHGQDHTLQYQDGQLFVDKTSEGRTPHGLLLDAHQVARQARFEHGETPIYERLRRIKDEAR